MTNIYALDGNGTEIADGKSAVRFNATDVGGDNFIITAKLNIDGLSPSRYGPQTGTMTVWKRVEVEYVRMDGSDGAPPADPVPVQQINEHFKKAFVQFSFLPERSVDPEFVDCDSSSSKDYWAMGQSENEAWGNLEAYVTEDDGEFSKENAGWFFLAAAHNYKCKSGLKSLVLYPRPQEEHDDWQQLSGWAFRGAQKGVNTDPNHKLYIILDSPHHSNVRVRAYKDTALVEANLVAEGTGNGGPIALHERNNSGLYGFVKVAYIENDSDVILVLADHGNATIAYENQITLDEPLPLGPGIDHFCEIEPSLIYIFNNNLSKSVYFLVDPRWTSIDGKTVTIFPHDYSPVDDPNTTAAKNLIDHYWTIGDTVTVKVKSPGAGRTYGISHAVFERGRYYFTGRVLFFSGAGLSTAIHELAHGLGVAHRCGNLDYKDDKSCVLAYDMDWRLSMPYDPDPASRTLQPWTNRNVGSEMCPYHIIWIRQTKLEEDSLGRRLGW